MNNHTRGERMSGINIDSEVLRMMAMGGILLVTLFILLSKNNKDGK